MVHATTAKTRSNANARIVQSYMFACNFSYITHEKKCTCYFASIIQYNFCFLLFAGSQLPGHLKGTIYICTSVIVFAVFLRKMDKRKEIQFNEWKFMHMKTSNNSSNQSDFNKRFFSYYFAVFLCTAEFCLHMREETSFGESLLMAEMKFATTFVSTNN